MVAELVLPTRVGMVRFLLQAIEVRVRAPHPRGDGPRPRLAIDASRRCSPPAWGWSATMTLKSVREYVLPTRVGMVRPCHPAR